MTKHPERNEGTASPVEFIPATGVWIKREDLATFGEANGTKARAIANCCKEAAALVTAGGRNSTQGLMAALIAKSYCIPYQFHTSVGPDTEIIERIRLADGQVVKWKPGHRSVYNARAREAAQRIKHAMFVPAWMEGPLMLPSVRAALVGVDRWPHKRLVVPVGSGMTLAAVLAALRGKPCPYKIIGVMVSKDPSDRLSIYAPPNWRDRVELIQAEVPYNTMVDNEYYGIPVDPIYSGKCIPFLRKGDMMWNSGSR